MMQVMFATLKGCKFVQLLNCKTLSIQAVDAVCLCVIKIIIIQKPQPTLCKWLITRKIPGIGQDIQKEREVRYQSCINGQDETRLY